MGLLYSFWLIGTGLGMILTNFLLDNKFKQPLVIVIIVWVVGMVLSFTIRDVEHAHYRTPSLRAQLRALRRQVRDMRPLLPGMLLQTLAAGMLLPVFPDFVSKHLGLTYTTYSYMIIVGGGLAMLGLLPMGRLADHYGKKWFLVMGFLALALALYMAPFAKTLWTAVAIAASLGIAYASVLPSWNALLAQYVPKEYKGIGWGLFSSIEGLGVLIGPSLGGFLALHTSSMVTVRLAATSLLIIALYYAFAPVRFEET